MQSATYLLLLLRELNELSGGGRGMGQDSCQGFSSINGKLIVSGTVP